MSGIYLVIAAGFAAAKSCFSRILSNQCGFLRNKFGTHFLKEFSSIGDIKGENASGGRITGCENCDFASAAIAGAAHSTSVRETNVFDLIPFENFSFSREESRLDLDFINSKSVVGVASNAVGPECCRSIVPNGVGVGGRRGCRSRHLNRGECRTQHYHESELRQKIEQPLQDGDAAVQREASQQMEQGEAVKASRGQGAIQQCQYNKRSPGAVTSCCVGGGPTDPDTRSGVGSSTSS